MNPRLACILLLVAVLQLGACAAAPEPRATTDAREHSIPQGTGVGAVDTRLALRVDADARALVLDLAPLRLNSHGMIKTPLLGAAVPFSGWLTAFDVELLDADGNVLPQELLHHVNVMLPDRRDLFRPIMQRLVAAGEETSRIELPWPFGVPVRQGERVVAYAMLHDTQGRDWGELTLRLRMHYDRGRRIAVQPFFMDASPPPGPAGWDLPPGRSERVWEATPAVDGRVLGVGGHLHRYGTELVLEDVAARRVLVRLRPITAADGSIQDVERRRFVWRLGIPLRQGRTYRITARYDNPTGDTIRLGGMGAIAGMIMAGGWPGSDTSHALYQDDVRILLQSDHDHHGHAGAADTADPAGHSQPHH